MDSCVLAMVTDTWCRGPEKISLVEGVFELAFGLQPNLLGVKDHVDVGLISWKDEAGAKLAGSVVTI